MGISIRPRKNRAGRNKESEGGLQARRIQMTLEEYNKYRNTTTDPIKVCKDSGRPFKSGNKVNTVKGIIIHPVLNIPAFTFLDDDSYVEIRRCKSAT